MCCWHVVSYEITAKFAVVGPVVWLDCVLVRVSVAVKRHQEKKSKLGRKGFIQLIFLQHCSLLKKVRTGTQTGQNPEGSSCHKSHGGMLLTGLLPHGLSILVPYKIQAHNPRNSTTYNGLGPPH